MSFAFLSYIMFENSTKCAKFTEYKEPCSYDQTYLKFKS